MASIIQENPLLTSPILMEQASIDDCINLFGMCLWESIDHLKRVSVPNPDFIVFESYVFSVCECVVLNSIKPSLIRMYNSVRKNLPMQAASNHFLDGILDKLENYMLHCKEIVGISTFMYNSDYQNCNSGLSQFDDILRITPVIVHQGLVLFYEDAITKIKNYKASQQEGGDALDFRIFETGQDLAIFYCTIMRTTVVAASFVRVCRFALARFISGDVRGCQLLLGRFLNDADILGLERLKNLESESTSDDE